MYLKLTDRIVADLEYENNRGLPVSPELHMNTFYAFYTCTFLPRIVLFELWEISLD